MKKPCGDVRAYVRVHACSCLWLCAFQIDVSICKVGMTSFVAKLQCGYVCACVSDVYVCVCLGMCVIVSLISTSACALGLTGSMKTFSGNVCMYGNVCMECVCVFQIDVCICKVDEREILWERVYVWECVHGVCVRVGNSCAYESARMLDEIFTVM